MNYGNGKKQRKIIELGKKDKLTFGDFVKLFGHKDSLIEINKLCDLSLIVIDESTTKNNEFVKNTKIKWLDV